MALILGNNRCIMDFYLTCTCDSAAKAVDNDLLILSLKHQCHVLIPQSRPQELQFTSDVLHSTFWLM